MDSWAHYASQQTYHLPAEYQLIELQFYVILDTKQVISETFPKPISWRGMEKLNLTQQKHTFANEKMYYNTKYTQKTKARLTVLTGGGVQRCILARRSWPAQASSADL